MIELLVFKTMLSAPSSQAQIHAKRTACCSKGTEHCHQVHGTGVNEEGDERMGYGRGQSDSTIASYNILILIGTLTLSSSTRFLYSLLLHADLHRPIASPTNWVTTTNILSKWMTSKYEEMRRLSSFLEVLCYSLFINKNCCFLPKHNHFNEV